ncbi:MAG: hypothetical protein J0I86_04420 [Mesorhizobium sp.]|nr:hypothetical protein [Mesorhizobium sp.]
MVKALILASLLVMAGCQSTPGSFCAVASPIRLSLPAIAAMSDSDVRAVLAHNEKGRRLCGWTA